MRMLHRYVVVFCCAMTLGVAGRAQNTSIVIPAGTPEDKDLAAISAESDAQRRIQAYQEFLKKYPDNKPATAYAEWQLSQQYLAAGETAKAMECVDYAVQGANVYNSIAKQPKPADMSDAEFAGKIKGEQSAVQNDYDFLETSAYNAIASEQDPNKRMTEIEKFTPAFPKSKYEAQVSQLALYSLRQLNQPQRLEAYGEKTLAANPDSIPTLLMMGDAYAAIALIGANPDTKEKKSYAGLAHVTLGRAELNQEKLVPAVADLKAAVTLLQDDAADQQQALFYLGYAYAKQNHKADAVASLQKAAAIDGPYAAPAKDMLAKINAAGTTAKK